MDALFRLLIEPDGMFARRELVHLRAGLRTLYAVIVVSFGCTVVVPGVVAWTVGG